MSKTLKSLKRLQSDFREIMKEPINGIGVLPLESNFYEWHINIKSPADSPFKGTIYHFVLIFSENYPSKAPKVKSKNFIPRDHISGEHICLNMLDDKGWSSAYTITSIVLQLQSYIFSDDENESIKKHDYKENVIKSINEVNNYKCSCGHDMKNNEVNPKIFIN